MANIPYTYLSMKKDGADIISCPLASEGVELSRKSKKAKDGKCCLMGNFDVFSDRIATRSAQKKLSLENFNEGEVHSITKEPFCGKTIIHSGTNLFCLGKDGLSVLSDKLPDAKSLFCVFMSKLYIYCAERIFSVNNLFECTEEEPYAPLMYEKIPTTFITIPKSDKPFNMLSPRITVTYTESQVDRFELPEDADITRPFEIYEGNKKLDPSICTFTEKMITINLSGIPSSRVVKIVYYLKDKSSMENSDFLSGCNSVIAFGGDTSGGTRVFFTGNENYKGRYYKSELMDPLYVSSEEFEIIGNGSENITCLKKMYGDLILFTEGTVYRMGYTLREDGVFFATKEISNGVGCDCPDSVQLIDNRVVFLNSGKGVFIIDSTETTGEQNIKPIAGNVLKGEGFGLIENDKEKLHKAYSMDFDRKYMLFVDGKAYIWDYDISAFSESGNYAKAQERLVWYLYDGLFGDIFFESPMGLSSLSCENCELYTFDEDFERKDVFCRYVSGEISRLNPTVRKYITEISFIMKKKSDAVYNLSAYSDGEKYYEVALQGLSDRKEKVKFRLPSRALYGFGFEISGVGEIEIEQVLVKCTAAKE